MRTRYRRIVRRRIEAALRVKMRKNGPHPVMDDPIEMAPEVIDLATGTLEAPAPRSVQRSWRRPQGETS